MCIFGEVEMSITYKNLNLFRFRLLRIILFSASFLGVFIAIFGLLGLLPFPTLYSVTLFLYSGVNFVTYRLFQKHYAYYRYAVHTVIFSSLMTFMLLTLMVLEDEFRLVWFFLIALSSFILGGRYYGFGVIALIITVVVTLYSWIDIGLSGYAIFTFVVSLCTFGFFAYQFLQKIEYDADLLQQRVEDEVQRRQVQEQILLHRYRMSNMGEMTDAIAHQWRQPLMQSSITLLNMQESMSAHQCDQKEHIVYLQQKMDQLIGLTSYMSKTIDDFRACLSGEGHKSRFTIVSVIEEVLSLMKVQLQGMSVQYDRQSECEVFTYRSEMIQVLITLISNASEIVQSRSVTNPMLWFEVLRRQESTEITIEDNAGGISPRIQEKIFDPYFTTKEQMKGTGLGLYIVKIMVEQNMGGEVFMTTGERGAKFHIRIPTDDKRDAKIL